MRMHVFQQLFAHIEKALPGIAPGVPIICVEILDEVDPGVLESVGIQVVETGDDV